MSPNAVFDWLMAGDPAIRWQTMRLAQHKHGGRVFLEMEKTGDPSRWNTLRALRVLRLWEG